LILGIERQMMVYKLVKLFEDYVLPSFWQITFDGAFRALASDKEVDTHVNYR
jgi:hypothetical protein